MSVVDYSHCAEDHRTLLILVKQIGNQINQKAFNKVFEKVSRVQQVHVEESGVIRNVWLRYKKSYPVENNDYGDFQTYRKVLGLISVGKCSNQNDVKDLLAEHKILQEKYGSTLYDSRCLVFGMDASLPSSCGSSKASLESENLASPESAKSSNLQNGENEVFHSDNVKSVPKSHTLCSDKDSGMFDQPNSLQDCDSLVTNGTSLQSTSITLDPNDLPNVNPAKNFKLADGSGCQEMCRDVSLNSLCSSSSSGSPTMDRPSPSSSRKLMVPPTVKSRSTHCILYPSVDTCEQLEHDVNEFITSLFWVLESKHLDQSFEKQEKVPLLTAAFEKKGFVGIDTDTRNYKKRCIGRMKKHIGDLALQAGLPLEALASYASAYELLKSVNDWLWLAATYEGQSAASITLLYPSQNRNTQLHRNSSYPVGMAAAKVKVINHSRSLPNGSDPVDYKNMGKNILSVDDIVEKFKEAILHYRKYHNASVIELECSIKAARFLSTQERYLEASDFLQNLYIVLPQSDLEKMQRFDALSQLYTEIGFHRKASFFKRLAAMKSVAQSEQNPNCSSCYRLLLQSLNGYKLTLDPKQFPKDIIYGWPGIQIQVLQDLVRVAEDMNHQDLSVRHMSFLLHTLLEYLSQAEQTNFCRHLEALTANCEGAPVPLALENGMVIPPVNFLNLPQVKTFKLQNLAPHLRPVKMISQHEKIEPDPRESIFIFSPIPRDRDRISKDSNRLSFKWVEGDVCEVALQVFNPLFDELKVTHMSLLADGIAFESFPACLSLPAKSGPYPVNLLGTPLGTGELKILGYSTHVLGVKSNCRLREIPAIKRPFFSIDVIPKLPIIHVTTSLPKASTFSSLGDTSYVVMSAAITMYSGESHECTVTVTNTGKEAVERVDLSLHTKLDKEKESAFFIWSKENLDTQLPIAVGGSASFTLYINAVGEFVNHVKSPEPNALNPSSARGSRSSSASSLTSTPNRRKPVVQTPEPFPPKTVEAVLQLQYTGGPGMVAEYCRQCAVAITVEVLPSIVITKWDVLPAEVPTHCYLVLDVLNSTTHEMELQYAANKRILIEGRDTCRIPVPVERCPLSLPPSGGSQVEVNDLQRKQRVVDACRNHLANLVDLQWTLSSLEVSGRASISAVTWTDAMLDVIFMSPIQWDILLNGRLFKVEDEFSFIVGDLISLSITLHNTSDIALHSLHLCIRGYQDHQNSHRNYRLETKRAVVGSDKVFIKDILPHEDYCHESGFVFFHTGNYKLDVSCSSKEHQGIWPRIKEPSTKPAIHVSRAAEKEWDSESSSHVWKCSPSIDITIVED